MVWDPRVEDLEVWSREVWSCGVWSVVWEDWDLEVWDLGPENCAWGSGRPFYAHGCCESLFFRRRAQHFGPSFWV